MINYVRNNKCGLRWKCVTQREFLHENNNTGSRTYNEGTEISPYDDAEYINLDTIRFSQQKSKWHWEHTPYLEGTVASSLGGPGGGYQYYVPNPNNIQHYYLPLRWG